MVGLLCVGLYSVLISGAGVGSRFFLAVWPLTMVLGLMALPLLWPGLFRMVVLKSLGGLSAIYDFWGRLFFESPVSPGSHLTSLERFGARLIDLAYKYQRDTWEFVRQGKLRFVGICLLSLVFIMARCLMAFLCLGFLGVEIPSLGEVIEIQLNLLFLLYFAPTPGSSGIAELLSYSSLAAIIPPGLSAYYNLIWRSSTLYLPALLGLLILALALFSDTKRVFQREALRHNEKPATSNRSFSHIKSLGHKVIARE
jgi:uncharacterized membrane protein YbhN (UPF0104 family)